MRGWAEREETRLRRLRSGWRRYVGARPVECGDTLEVFISPAVGWVPCRYEAGGLHHLDVAPSELLVLDEHAASAVGIVFATLLRWPR